jgi:hypothetical protein
VAYIGRPSIVGNFVKLDAITAVNGQAAYTMQNGGSNFTDYESVNQFLVSLNGTIQAPTTSFSVSGSTLTFVSNLATGDVIDFIMVFGNSLSAGVPTDATVSTAKIINGAVTNDKIASSIINSQTAETSIADADEVLIYDSSATALRKMTKSNFVSGLGSATGEFAFRVTKSGAQTISSGTSTVLTFDTETFDIGSAFASNKFTVPSGKDGVYFFHLGVITNENIGGDKFQASIRVNGGGVSFTANSGGSGSYRAGITLSAVANLSAGDYVDCDVFQQHGTVTVSGGSFCTFQGFRVS